ncbi:MAG: hypothetical protein IKE43_07040 [Coriobacteriales bacterium]|nr:hypothetical protein [Coriobacteriales bacterium]
MTVYTSASANKQLRQLQDEKDRLLALENQRSTYTRTADEPSEPPLYSYTKTSADIERIDAQTRTLRHALHVFNATYVLPKAGITLDEALILLAQLNNTKARLAIMRNRAPKERLGALLRSGEEVEYRFANYDIAQTEADYEDVIQKIAELQLEIDLTNQTQTFEVGM